MNKRAGQVRVTLPWGFAVGLGGLMMCRGGLFPLFSFLPVKQSRTYFELWRLWAEVTRDGVIGVTVRLGRNGDYRQLSIIDMSVVRLKGEDCISIAGEGEIPSFQYRRGTFIASERQKQSAKPHNVWISA